MKKSGKILFFVLIFVGILLSIKGRPGSINLTNYDRKYWVENGPFELSPERGRFTLTYSIVENGSTIFDPNIAGFASPDLGYKDGKFVSLFAPALSYIVAPGYIFGKMLGHSQFGVNTIIACFALVNTILVYLISKKLGTRDLVAMTAGVLFIFATPAFSYAGSLYQHHISTLLMLNGFLALMGKKVNLLHLSFVFVSIAVGIMVDYPNAVVFAPLGLLAVSKIFNFKNKKNHYKLKMKPVLLLSILASVPIITLSLSYNKVTYGNHFQFAGTVTSVAEVRNGKALFEGEEGELTGEISATDGKTAVGFFKTRNLINGLYTHTFSLDRGVLVFAPILVFAYLGGRVLFKKNEQYLWFFVMTVGLNLVLYSLWGDPWGGWAFGSRYLIPSYSLMAILVAVSLPKIKRSSYLKTLFIFVMVYSIFVNTLGAVTSNSNLPRVEAEELSNRSGVKQKYTFTRNIELLSSGKSKAFIYNLVGNDLVNTWEYFFLTFSVPVALTIFTLGQYFAYFDLSFIDRKIKSNRINLKEQKKRKWK